MALAAAAAAEAKYDDHVIILSLPSLLSAAVATSAIIYKRRGKKDGGYVVTLSSSSQSGARSSPILFGFIDRRAHWIHVDRSRPIEQQQQHTYCKRNKGRSVLGLSSSFIRYIIALPSLLV